MLNLVRCFINVSFLTGGANTFWCVVYYQSGCSVKDAIRKYSYQEHNMKKPVCSTQVMKRRINRFENTSNVHYNRNEGWTSKTNDVATIFKVVEAKELVESTNNYGKSSVRKISTKSGVKPTTVYRILTPKLRQPSICSAITLIQQRLRSSHFCKNVQRKLSW